jgi:RNA polymerase sigma-70 factor, ECF subfamily
MAYRTALRIVGQAADAEDVVQDVFLEVHRLWQTRDVTNWEAVLRSLATRRAIDLLRRSKDEESLQQPITDHRAAPEDLIHEQELQAQVRRALARLPRQQAEVFALHFLEQQSHQEIAAALKISAHAVAVALHKARAKLETDLERLLSPEEY